ncbi:MAG TPA: hypothetical protein VIG62_16980 [Blastocatellia bacterium]|jgi:hypothetical protein
MENEDRVIAHKKRRLSVYADDEDVLVQALEIPEADYECMRANGSWPEKSLLEGDIILFAYRRDAEGGDIVLIEDEEGRERIGFLAAPGLLETKSGFRPLTGREKIIGVGVALARRLRMDRVNREAQSEEAGEAEGIDPDFSLTGFPPES